MTLWTVAHQAPLSTVFSRQEYCSGLPCPALGDVPSPRIEPTSLMSPVLSGGFLTTSVIWEIQGSSYKILCTYLNSLTCTLKIGFAVLNYIMIILKDTFIPMFIGALFTVAKTCQQPKCPCTNEWITKMLYIYIVEYHSFL